MGISLTENEWLVYIENIGKLFQDEKVFGKLDVKVKTTKSKEENEYARYTSSSKSET